MDIKEFIKQTVSGIVDATIELQAEYEATGTIINPPVSLKERDLFEENGAGHTYRRVEIIEFDVAVTATAEKAGGGKAGVRIFAAEASVDGSAAKKNEEVSRVRFAIPISLSPSAAESVNREVLERRLQKQREAMSRSKTVRRY